jgi:ubiquinol-cytochrome c reductase cytochrome c1 subunit
MREFKILIVLIFFTAITYYGIEPYAHHVMHPETEKADYAFSDLEEFNVVGNEAAGKELFAMNCQACHSLSSDDILPPMEHKDLVEAYGVYPPDLSTAGDLYDTKFLANFIKNPANASFDSIYKKHKEAELAYGKASAKTADEVQMLQAAYEKNIAAYGQKTKISMPGFDYLSNQEIADIIAYMQRVKRETTPREATAQACGRCHSVEYGGMTENSSKEQLVGYLGSFPPDLSQMIKSKGEDYLHKFINDPQKQLLGTAMPRVGLTKAAEAKIVHYLEEVGDAKKSEREELGLYVILFMIVMSVFAYFFKVNVFKEVH